MTRTRSLLLLPATALLLASCQTATDMMFEPAPNDPLDGYEGSLAQAGINTDMDWGPGQNLLLSKYQAAQSEIAQLRKDHEELIATNQNLQAELTAEQGALREEKKERAQSDADIEVLRGRVRERDAKILSLQIEKAKLEQERLQREITTLNEGIRSLSTPAATASEPPRQP
ncbi:MAG: hypothetical protein ACON4Z_10050 [Planctomycetota bacterium]